MKHEKCFKLNHFESLRASEVYLRMTTMQLELDQHEENMLLILDGRQCWEHAEKGERRFHLITSHARGSHTPYVDADECPWDDSHDGNGWNETVRHYEAAQETVAPGDPLHQRLLDGAGRPFSCAQI